MRDIVITASRIRKELMMLLYCYLAANIVNVASIIFYQTQWIELLTWQRFILFIGFIFYVLSALIRVVFYLVKGRTSKRRGEHLHLSVHNKF